MERPASEPVGGSDAARAAGTTGRWSKLRVLARWRRRFGWLLLLLPVLAVVAIDLGRRGPRIVGFERHYLQTYAAAVLESLVLWTVLLYAASRRRGTGAGIAAVLFVAFVTLSFGGQQYFYEQYRAYVNVDVSMFASSFMDSVMNQLAADLGNYARVHVPPLIAAIALVWVARRIVRPRRRRARVMAVVAPLVLVATFFIPTQHRHIQASTPDVLYMHAVGGLLRTQAGFTEQSNQLRPRVRVSKPVARIEKKPPLPRNVLFVILESVRADATCVEYSPGCQETGFTNALAPNRFPFHQMRSMDSCTAISLAVLWGGVGAHASRESMHTQPLIFDYARAAGWDTAFWTSQNMMFGNARLWVQNLGVSKFVSATELDPSCDLDMGAPEKLLAERVNSEIGSLHEPFLAVVQLSNVHYPYYLETNGPKPFEPWTTSKAPDDNPHFFNFYKNAVHQQDQHVASMIAHLRAIDAGKRTVVVYTSDHGEAFREHGQMGHTFSVFDEEVHVPAWIDAPPGTLTDEEQKNLRAKKDAYLFHVDLAPTIVDLMGALDDPALDPYESEMLGSSLLRPGLTERALAMTNCGGVWSCAFENWGVMKGSVKLEAREWDEGWHCYDLATDPDELTDLGVEKCKPQLEMAMKTFGRLPSGKAH